MIICSQNYVAVGFSSKEVMYVTLPLYHASALNLAVLNVISAGKMGGIINVISAVKMGGIRTSSVLVRWEG